MLNHTQVDQNDKANCYYLPVSLAFLNSRALLFWEIMYYMAYCWQGPRPASLKSGFAEPVAFFNLTSTHFCQLLYGRGFSKSQYETGRKILSQLSRQAHSAGLLYRLEEADDPYLNTFGSQASQSFLVPIYRDQTLIPGLNRPRTFLENGWARQIGNSYEHHLFNLLSLEPLPDSARPNFPALAERLAVLYTAIPSALQSNRLLQPITHLTRQLEKAWRNLVELNLIAPAHLNPAFYNTFPTPTPKIDLNQAQSEPLDRYYQKNPQRAALLARLIATDLLQSSEIKAAWTTLADFSTSEDFTYLLQNLRQREKLTTTRSLSWRQVETAARLQRSKRGRVTSSPISKKPRPIFHRLNKLTFGQTEAENSLIIRPIRSAFNLRQPMTRVKLEVWVDVPNRRFYDLTPAQSPTAVTLRLRLYDAEHQLIFEDVPHVIQPYQADQSWTIALEKFFQPFKHSSTDFKHSSTDLLYLELAVLDNSFGQSVNWFGVSIRLGFYPVKTL